MIIQLDVQNVQEALPRAIELMKRVGVRSDSRNGAVLMAPCPVVTAYSRPMERVMFHAERDANPFFHLFESIWMLAGRRDVALPARFAAQMRDYSDDGVTFNAAYGYRWRQSRGFCGLQETESLGNVYVETERRDQLTDIIKLLRKNPRDRQCVLQIWDHLYDLGTNSKDHACNLVATFQTRPSDGRLCMVVFCRSNDIVWGCYGANAVHMSALLEYVATLSGLEIGDYVQISVNWHAYVERPDWDRVSTLRFDGSSCPYRRGNVTPHRMIHPDTGQERWDAEARAFCKYAESSDLRRYRPSADPFFTDVAYPMLAAWSLHRDQKRTDAAIELLLRQCAATDWRLAGVEWLTRRLK